MKKYLLLLTLFLISGKGYGACSNVGYQSIGASGGLQNATYASSVTVSGAGTVTQLVMYCATNGNFSVALYDADGSNHATTMLVNSGTVSATAAGWVTCSVSSTNVTAKTYYLDEQSLVDLTRYDAGSPSYYVGTYNYPSWPTFSGSPTGTAQLSIFMIVCPTTPTNTPTPGHYFKTNSLPFFVRKAQPVSDSPSAYTSTPTLTPTATTTSSPTVTQTPWLTHSPTGQSSLEYGDSYTAGFSATPGTNAYSDLVNSKLNQWYPTVGSFYSGVGGTTAYDRLVSVGGSYNNYQSFVTTDHGLYYAVWSVIYFGQNESRIANSTDEPGSFYLASTANATTYSQVFKTEVMKGVTIFQNSYPGTDPMLPQNVYEGQIVIPTIPDLSTAGGGGYTPFDPANWPDYVASLAQYNARINELPALYTGVYVADVRAALYGCSDCYEMGYGYPHPTVKGHAIIAQTIENAFGSPPR